ncbi:beta-glucosidase BglX [Tamlana sp. 2201CG12-4]|uniref:beta-glucosidase BglX n=1 Tax=Tamlana sp. 2201CG12-4 TaxID=3112582 RepID=UPI002DBA6D22|nr:beta-glucosidase BglX [Tamlana sp. 2201CG12-4]MEC3905717.1 beta-glucosidase BglX [Tamlana sp. 2201CG12-4]
MKKQLIIILLLIGVSVAAQNPEMDKFIDDLMGKMTLEEKLGQLNLASGAGNLPVISDGEGKEDIIRKGLIGVSGGRKSQEIAVNESRLGIPLLYGRDIIHGSATIFPIPLAMACTWDMDLIEKSARIAAIEASAVGINWTYSPMVDIARDPRWGRIAEGAGEDPFLGSKIGEALVKGYQGDDLSANNTIMACVKHFALYGASEAGRDYNTVDMSRLTMFQDYFPPYKAAIEAGAGSAMTSFNLVDGIPATGNKWLLNDLLREQWGFNGLVVTDFTAINEMMHHGVGDLQEVAVLALKAGVNIDMVGQSFIGTLGTSLAEGKVTQEEIDQVCRVVLEAKYKLGLFDDPFKYFDAKRAKKDILTPNNKTAAREIAKRSIVLLRNNKNILPLKKEGTIAVIGPLANSRIDMLGTWANTKDTTHVVSLLRGVKDLLKGKAEVLYAKGADFTTDPYLLNVNRTNNKNVVVRDSVIVDHNKTELLLKEAIEAAEKSDVILAHLGEPRAWSGEAASRADISIPENQINLLKAMIKTGKPVVLVLGNGRPMTLTWENSNVDAILETWHLGIEAGHAIAEVLFGDYNPSGKLTATFPRHVGQIPVYYNHKKTGRPKSDFKFTTKYLDIPNTPLYPFGYGLSYTNFDYSEITLNKSQLKGDDMLQASVTITNTGDYAGEEIVQLYINDPIASVSRAVKELKGFNKVHLKPQESKTVTFKITPNELKFFNSDLKYDWESGDFNIYIGTSSAQVKEVKINWLK